MSEYITLTFVVGFVAALLFMFGREVGRRDRDRERFVIEIRRHEEVILRQTYDVHGLHQVCSTLFARMLAMKEVLRAETETDIDACAQALREIEEVIP